MNSLRRLNPGLMAVVACAVLAGLVAWGLASPSPQKAPSFTLSEPGGTRHTLPAAGDEIEIYYFWATWCPFCREIKPHLQSLVEEFGDRVRVYAINFREYEDRDPVAYLRDGGWDFTLLLEGERIAEDYGAWVLPGIFVVDGGGRIRFSLYQNPMPNPEGYESLSSAEQATIRAPWWGARIRERVESLL